MIAINLQTSFLTPPFGFALFYLRGVAPPQVTTGQLYRGVIPFVLIQLLALLVLALFPALATWLPDTIYG
jgi:TRAP-type mannitol/chloroaromatic compound transport system permease large subunit